MNLRISAILFSSALLWVSCGGDKKEDAQEVEETAEVVDNEAGDINEIAEFKFHIFVANIPSPLETMVKLPGSGVTFNKDLVNPTDNSTQYTTLAKKAVAYGIYGTDLGYATVFEQSDLVTDYFATTKSLAEELGAGDNFNRTVAERFNRNMANRDSLLFLMDQAIGESEDYLRNNQRLELASLMMAGSWVESQHILLNGLMGKDTTSAMPLFKKLPEQKNHLKSLVDVLREQKGNKDTEAAAKTLEPLIASYNAINSPAVDAATIEKLKGEINAVREKLVK